MRASKKSKELGGKGKGRKEGTVRGAGWATLS
jgi:hypothetical protein